MADRITKEDITKAFKWWADAYGFRLSRGWNPKTRKNDPGFALDYAPIYGGYNIVELSSENTGESQPFGGMRYSPRDLYNMLMFAERSVQRKRSKSR
jgi:hypothetical protein